LLAFHPSNEIVTLPRAEAIDRMIVCLYFLKSAIIHARVVFID
jgi:hypothetical protein